MNQSFISKASLYAKFTILSTALGLSLNSCGSGGGSSDEQQIAPGTLEGIVMTLEEAFTLEFARTSGSSGNESGAVDYVSLSSSFPIGAGEGIGADVAIPNDLDSVNYTYERTGSTTGRITLTWNNQQAYPYENIFGVDESPSDDLDFLDIFWGGPSEIQTSLILDISFRDSGGVIGSSTARIRSIYWYRGTQVITDDNGTSGDETDDIVTTTVFAAPVEDSVGEVDRATVNFRLLAGDTVATGYEVDFSSDTVSSVVYDDLNRKSLEFIESGTGIITTIAFQTAPGGILDVSNESEVRDSGIILVDEDGGVNGAGGTYGFAASGGSSAVISVIYDDTANSTTISNVYTLSFTSFTGGTWVDSNGQTGTFNETFFDTF